MTDNKLAGTIERLLYCDRNNCAPSAKTVKSSLEYVSAILEVNKSLEADNALLTAKLEVIESESQDAMEASINVIESLEATIAKLESENKELKEFYKTLPDNCEMANCKRNGVLRGLLFTITGLMRLR